MSLNIPEAKRRLPLPDLLTRLGLGDHAKKTARCPWPQNHKHGDRNPSFGIFQDGNGWGWKCFVCGGGDEITFLEKHEGLARGDAMRRFCEMAGVGNGSKPTITGSANAKSKKGAESLENARASCFLPSADAGFAESFAKRLGVSAETIQKLIAEKVLGFDKARGAIAFACQNVDGSLAALHLRGKRPDGQRWFEWTPKGCTAGLWRLPVVKRAERVILPEGETDAIAALDRIKLRFRGRNGGKAVTIETPTLTILGATSMELLQANLRAGDHGGFTSRILPFYAEGDSKDLPEPLPIEQHEVEALADKLKRLAEGVSGAARWTPEAARMWADWYVIQKREAAANGCGFASRKPDHVRKGYVTEVKLRNGEARKVKTRGGKRAVDIELGVLSNALNLAERRGLIQSNPIARRGRYTTAAEVRHCREVAPTPEGLQEIIGWLRGRNETAIADLVAFLAYSGLRIGEALPLTWEAVNLGEGLVNVQREKKGVNPWVAILPEMETLLREMQTRAASALLFPSPFDASKSRDQSAVRHRLTAACKALGLGHVTPHGLRSHFVTQARQSGLTDAEIAMLIGDKSGPAIIAHTYGDLRPDHLLAQARCIRLTVAASGEKADHASHKASHTSPDDSGKIRGASVRAQVA